MQVNNSNNGIRIDQYSPYDNYANYNTTINIQELQKLKEELIKSKKESNEKDKEINYWRAQITVLQSRIKEMDSKANFGTPQRASTKDLKDSFISQTEKTKYERQILALQCELNENQDKIKELTEQINKLQNIDYIKPLQFKLRQYEDQLKILSIEKSTNDITSKEREELSIKLHEALANIRKYEVEINGLKAQLGYSQKMTSLVAEYEIKIKDLQNKVDTLEKFDKNAFNETAVSRIKEYDEKFRILVNENSSLKIEIEQYRKRLAKYTEIENDVINYKAKYEELTLKLAVSERTQANLIEKLNIQTQMTQDRKIEVDTWKNKFSDSQKLYEAVLTNKDQKIKDLENQLEQSLALIDQHKNEALKIKMKNQEHERAKSHATVKYEQEKKQVELDLKLKFDEEKKLIEYQKNVEISDLKSKLLIAEENISAFQIKQILYFIEIERLHNISSQYFKELQQAQEANQMYDVEYEEKFRNQRKSLENDKRRYEIFIDKLKAQTLEEEERIKQLIAENERLSEFYKQKLEELTFVKAENEKYISNIKALQAKIQELKNKQEIEKEEHERLVDELKSALEAQENKLTESNTLNEQQKQEINALKNRFKELEKLVNEEKSAITNEKEEMRKARDMYKLELESVRKKYNELISGVGIGNSTERTSYKDNIASYSGNKKT